jgi:hypothetical protein
MHGKPVPPRTTSWPYFELPALDGGQLSMIMKTIDVRLRLTSHNNCGTLNIDELNRQKLFKRSASEL